MKRIKLVICFLFFTVFSISTVYADISETMFKAIEGNSLRRIKRAIKSGEEINSVDENGVSILMHAVRNCSVDIVEWLIDNGADPQAKDYAGTTVLMYAAMGGNEDNVSFIIQQTQNRFWRKGSDVNEVDSFNNSALTYAIYANDTPTCKVLVQKGADINQLSGLDFKFTPAAISIINGSNEVLNYLIQEGIAINRYDNNGMTLLEYSVITNNANSVKILLNAGADPNLLDIDMDSPLQLAIENKNIEIAELLLQNGADPNIKNSNNLTPLMNLCLSTYWDGQFELAQLLLRYGSDVNCVASDAFNNGTALMFATSSANIDLVQLLIENGALIDAFDSDGSTALRYAVNQNLYSIAELLLSKGANPNIIFSFNGNTRSYLQNALSVNYIEMAKLLINYGADVNFTDSVGDSMVKYAILAANSLEALKLLVNSGADLNIVDANGQTPLIWGSQICSTEIIQYILRSGVWVDEADYDGYTSLIYATLNSTEKPSEALNTVSILLEYGADPNICAINGLTPLMAAIQADNIDIINQLLANGANCDGFDVLFAILSKDLEICKTIISPDINLDFYTTVDGISITPLIASIMQDLPLITDLLLKSGADMYFENEEGFSAIDFAAIYSRTNGARMLIRHGADVNKYNSAGYTPLMLAAQFCSTDILPVFLNQGAFVNSFDKDSSEEHFTPIFFAICSTESEYLDYERKVDTLLTLISHGADVNVLSTKGESPLSMAIRQNSSLEIIKLLVNSGADINAIINGTSILDIATDMYSEGNDVLNYLISEGTINAY